MNIISRQHYTQLIENYCGKQTIIVLIGQRRVGKSYVLKDFATIKEKEHANVIYIDKESREFDAITNAEELNQYIDKKLRSSKTNYILIDEVQEIEDYERSIRAYRVEPNCEVIITGSNAEIFSADLANKLGGRYHTIYIQSLTYLEFLDFFHLENNDDALQKYIQVGGLPGLVNYNIDNLREVSDYQSDVFNTVLLKDVVLRHKVRNVPFLEKLCHYIADNTGKLISSTGISKYIKSHGETATTDLTIKYLNYLAEAFILGRVSRFDIHGKRILETNEKFYFEDHGIRNRLVGNNRDKDIEKIIENIVYQHLVHLGYDITVGQLQVGEIDFVCERSAAERRYVQVAYLIANDETREREFGRLMSIKDNYPKYVISMTPLVRRTDDNGIIHLGLREFLTTGLP